MHRYLAQPIVIEPNPTLLTARLGNIVPGCWETVFHTSSCRIKYLTHIVQGENVYFWTAHPFIEKAGHVTFTFHFDWTCTFAHASTQTYSQTHRKYRRYAYRNVQQMNTRISVDPNSPCILYKWWRVCVCVCLSTYERILVGWENSRDYIHTHTLVPKTTQMPKYSASLWHFIDLLIYFVYVNANISNWRREVTWENMYALSTHTHTHTYKYTYTYTSIDEY